MGLGKMGRKCKRGRVLSLHIRGSPASPEEPHCQGDPVAQPLHRGHSGWMNLCCRMGVRGCLCLLGCLEASLTSPHRCHHTSSLWQPECLQTLPSVAVALRNSLQHLLIITTAKRKSTLSSMRKPKPSAKFGQFQKPNGRLFRAS